MMDSLLPPDVDAGVAVVGGEGRVPCPRLGVGAGSTEKDNVSNRGAERLTGEALDAAGDVFPCP